MFVKAGSPDRVLVAGRWTAWKTAKIYINSGLAMLTELQVPKSLLIPFHRIFSSWNSKPSLEPVLLENRAGGRGKSAKSAKRRKRLRERGLILFFASKFVAFYNDCLCLVPEFYGLA